LAESPEIEALSIGGLSHSRESKKLRPSTLSRLRRVSLSSYLNASNIFFQSIKIPNLTYIRLSFPFEEVSTIPLVNLLLQHASIAALISRITTCKVGFADDRERFTGSTVEGNMVLDLSWNTKESWIPSLLPQFPNLHTLELNTRDARILPLKAPKIRRLQLHHPKELLLIPQFVLHKAFPVLEEIVLPTLPTKLYTEHIVLSMPALFSKAVNPKVIFYDATQKHYDLFRAVCLQANILLEFNDSDP